jgi:hypothetical protein
LWYLHDERSYSRFCCHLILPNTSIIRHDISSRFSPSDTSILDAPPWCTCWSTYILLFTRFIVGLVDVMTLTIKPCSISYGLISPSYSASRSTCWWRRDKSLWIGKIAPIIPLFHVYI